MADDPQARAAIARFEAAKHRYKQPGTSAPAVRRKGSARRFVIGSLIILGLLLSSALFFIEWVSGESWRITYTRLVKRELDWQLRQRPSLNAIWWLLRLPTVADIPAVPSLLYPRAQADAHDPSLKGLKSPLPDRQFVPYLRNAHDGDTILLPPGRYTDCAVIQIASLTLKSLQPHQAQFDGGACQGKAALVARGAVLHLEGLVFKNIRVSDGNGAGIRLEKGLLDVGDSIFYNSENGILAGGGDGVQLHVHDSLFTHLGSCDNAGGCAHAIYAGYIGTTLVERTTFADAADGHFLKSRAHHIEVRDSLFDGSRGVASYLIDLPHGASGRITGNKFIKGPHSRNRCCVIRVAGEGERDSRGSLFIEQNEVTSQLPLTVFMWNDGKRPVHLSHNLTRGWMMLTHGPAVRAAGD